MSSSDDVVRLREWGSERIHVLPASSPAMSSPTSPISPGDLWLVRTEPTGALELTEQPAPASCRHALLSCTEGRWSISDLGTGDGLQQDGARRAEIALEPGIELRVAGTTLIAESQRSIDLRRFCSRILGWAPDRAHVVDRALRSIRLGATRRAALVLCGDHDVVPIACGLHRRTLGAERPFIVCDPRRSDTAASVRSPVNYESGMAALEAASGGTLCARRSRLPRDFAAVVARLRETDAGVQLMIGADLDDADHAFLAVPAPIQVPPLRDRRGEIVRIIDEYAIDAIAELGASALSFTDADRQWVIKHAAISLPEIEKATLRLVALKTSVSMGSAARRLGMAPISLSRWIGRRPQPAVHANP
ncbi:MAG TPA: FHA domain-containing protein [Kofleriaceae bacterium]|nr:FHA domain-containing protein [Kofleriaceae bacterium]